ncbi:MAG: LON peptidase substrate-binding domain-containing protein [Actinobacteria bacterium]|nr:LON peptidase substrate-binding domain-containing protein [Actinomycetota bacterium]
MEVGLFPLGLVLLPTEQVPLHIFEPRYRELIAECLDSDEPFGLVYADEDGVRQVGTLATVVEVTDRFEDGRLNVVVEGGERFRLLELTEGRSFQTGTIEPLADRDDPAPKEDVERAIALFGRLVELTGADVELSVEELEPPSYTIGSRFELASELKLELLEETSERVRLRRLCEILETVATAVIRQREIAERAAKNGHVETS